MPENDLKLGVKVSVDGKSAQSDLNSVREDVADVGRAAGVAGRQASAGGAAIEAAAEGAASELKQTAAAGKQVGKDIGSGTGLGSERLRGLKNEAGSIRDAIKGVGVEIAGLAALPSLGQGIRDVTALADSYKNLRARVDLAAGSTEAGAAAFERLFQIADRTAQPVEAIGTLYARVGTALRELGRSQEDILGLTETVAQAFRVSGASAQEAENSIIQLAQGLASGALRGEELNSVLEQGPRLAQALADGLGVSRGELRKLAEDGKLTADAVTDALLSQSAAIDEEYSKLPDTVGTAFTRLRNNFLQYIGEVDAANGITEGAAKVIGTLASNLDTLAVALKLAGEIALANLAVKGAQSAFAFAQQIDLSNLSVKGLGNSLKALPTSVKVALAVVGFELLQEAGDLIGELAAKAAGADRITREASERRQAQLQQEIGDLIRAGAQADQFLNIQRLTEEQAARLGDAARERYEAELRGAEASLLQTNSLLLRERELAELRGQATDDYDKRLQRVAKQLVEVRAAQENLTKVQLAAAAAEVSGVTVEAQRLAQAFVDAAHEGGKTDKALAEIGRRIAGLSFDGIRNGIDALRLLGDEGRVSAGQIDQAIGGALRNLTANDLQNFEVTARAVFEGVAGKADELAAAVDGVRNALLDRLGVDAQQVLTGIDIKTGELIASFTALVNSPGTDPRIITAAFEQLLKTVDSREEIDALKAALGETQLVGVDAFEQIARRVEELKFPLTEQEQAVARLNQQQAELLAAADARLERERLAASEARAAAAERQQQHADEAEALTDLAAIQARIGGAESQGQLRDLRELLTAAYLQGEIAANDYSATLDAINQKQEQLTETVNIAIAGFAELSKAAQTAVDSVLQKGAVGADAINERFRQAGEVQARFADQSRQLEGLLGQLADGADRFGLHATRGIGAGAGQLQTLVDQAESALGRFDLLDEQDLSRLRGAIAAARSDLTRLRDSASATVATLRDELDQLQGREDEIEKRRAANRRADIQAQLAVAQQSGDASSVAQLREALSLLSQIEAERTRQRAAETATASREQASPVDAQRPSTTTPTIPTNVPQVPPATSQVVRVEFVVGASRAFPGSFSRSDAQGLIDALERAAGVALVN